jgi:ribonuclease P protein component
MNAPKAHTLSSKEKLRSKKDFEKLYSSGKTITTGSKKLKAVFVSERSAQGGVKVASVVPKKLGKAVWRNRIKRLIKESYRLNKHILVEKYKKSNEFLKIIISAYSINEINYKKIKLSDIMPEVVELMRKVAGKEK